MIFVRFHVGVEMGSQREQLFAIGQLRCYLNSLLKRCQETPPAYKILICYSANEIEFAFMIQDNEW